MSAYIVLLRNETRDPEEMKKYGELAPRAPTQKLEIVAAKTGRFKVLEGGPAEAVVILKFPCWDDALEWYDSPEYQEARVHRLWVPTRGRLWSKGSIDPSRSACLDGLVAAGMLQVDRGGKTPSMSSMPGEARQHDLSFRVSHQLGGISAASLGLAGRLYLHQLCHRHLLPASDRRSGWTSRISRCLA